MLGENDGIYSQHSRIPKRDRRGSPSAQSDPTVSLNERKYRSKNPLRRACIRNFEAAVRQEIIGLAPATLLDAGCGEGLGLLNLETLRIDHVFGVEIRPEAASKAAANLHTAQVVVSDVLSLPYPDKTFDIVVCLEVLEHLLYPSDALKELIRVTNQFILVSVPYEPYFRLGNLFTFRNFAQLGNDPGHLNHWGKNSFLRFLSNHAEILNLRTPFPWLLALIECQESAP